MRIPADTTAEPLFAVVAAMQRLLVVEASRIRVASELPTAFTREVLEKDPHLIAAMEKADPDIDRQI